MNTLKNAISPGTLNASIQSNEKITECMNLLQNQALNKADNASLIGKGIKSFFKANLRNEILLIVIASIIIAISSAGYTIKNKCESNDINPNVTITLKGFMGFGIGILLYSLLFMFNLVNPPIIIILGILLSTIGCVFMYSYNKLSDDCKATSELSADLAVGIIGAGVGIIFHLLAYYGIDKVFTPSGGGGGLNKFLILVSIICVISIVVSAIVINMANSCTKIKEGESISTQKNGAIGGLSTFVLILLGILIYFIKKK